MKSYLIVCFLTALLIGCNQQNKEVAKEFQTDTSSKLLIDSVSETSLESTDISETKNEVSYVGYNGNYQTTYDPVEYLGTVNIEYIGNDTLKF